MITKFEVLDFRTKKQEQPITDPVPTVDKKPELEQVSTVSPPLAPPIVDNKPQEEILSIPKKEIEEIKTEIVIPEQKPKPKPVKNTEVIREKELKDIDMFRSKGPITVSKASNSYNWRWIKGK